jgi:hypothetical protein
MRVEYTNMIQEMVNIGAALGFTAVMMPFYVFYINGGVEKMMERVAGYFMTANEFAVNFGVAER